MLAPLRSLDASMTPPRAPRWTAGVAAALALVLALAWRFNFLVDDAFISFRYARHLAQGHGLVWNLGENPPVEGFSNFLWVLLCAGIDALGADVLVWSRVTSVLCALALTWLVARCSSARADDSSTSWSTLMFACLPSIGVWATGGLETMAFCLAVFGCFEALVRRGATCAPIRAALFAAAAVLLRADGFVWLACALTSAALVRSLDARAEASSETGAQASPWRALRPVFAAAGAGALVLGAYLAWRYSYFGEWGPNTARVKVHLGALALERGSKYVASLCSSVLTVPLFLALALWALRRDTTRLAAPALLFVGASWSYVALVGGDWMMMHRMLAPSLAFAALGGAAGLAALSSTRARAGVGVLGCVLALAPGFDLHLAPRALRELTHFRWSQEYRSEHAMWRKGVDDIEEWIAIGRALALHTRPGESMALGNIGAFGYFAENLVVHDQHGLTNKAPLVAAQPDGRGMPGHDFKVDPAAFADLELTYLNARIVAADQPYAEIPENWREVDAAGRVRPNAKALERFEFLEKPLPPEQGFAPGRVLLLIRLR